VLCGRMCQNMCRKVGWFMVSVRCQYGVSAVVGQHQHSDGVVCCVFHLACFRPAFFDDRANICSCHLYMYVCVRVCVCVCVCV
jgi:hypothetical protein